jgi:hypothetical protein
MRRIALLLSLFLACNSDSFTDDGGVDAQGDNVVSGGDGATGDGSAKDVVTKPPHYCETIDAQFCADFDIPDNAGAGFGPPNTLGGWTFAFQDASVVSKPVAVRVDTNTNVGAAFVENPNISQGVSGGGINTKLTVEADVYLPAAVNTPDPLFVFRAGVVPAPVQLTFGLAVLTNAWRLVHPLGGSPVLIQPQPPPNAWLHANLSIDLNANNVLLVLSDSSSNTYTANMSAATALDGGAGNYPGFIHVGADDPYPNAVSLTFDVDNVVAHWQ